MKKFSLPNRMRDVGPGSAGIETNILTKKNNGTWLISCGEYFEECDTKGLISWALADDAANYKKNDEYGESTVESLKEIAVKEKDELLTVMLDWISGDLKIRPDILKIIKLEKRIIEVNTDKLSKARQGTTHKKKMVSENWFLVETNFGEAHISEPKNKKSTLEIFIEPEIIKFENYSINTDYIKRCNSLLNQNKKTTGRRTRMVGNIEIGSLNRSNNLFSKGSMIIMGQKSNKSSKEASGNKQEKTEKEDEK